MMNNPAQWVSMNSEFLLVLLTLIYVVTTISIMHYNKESIKQMKEISEEESRPYIFVSIEKQPRDEVIYLVIQNTGKQPGFINSLEVDPKISFYIKNGEANYLKDTIVMPGQKIRLLLNGKDPVFQRVTYSVKVNYYSINMKNNNKIPYMLEYSINTTYMNNQGYLGEKEFRGNSLTELDCLTNISVHLHDIRDKI